MNRVTSLLSFLVLLGSLGCSVGTESSDDVIETSDEQSLTHVTESTDQKASAPAQQVRETMGFVSARSVSAGPQPDPWAPVADTTTDPNGPQPDPWKKANHRVPQGNGSISTTDKH